MLRRVLGGEANLMWSWMLVASAVLTAIFIVITLAQLEAGARVKFKKSLALSCCFLAILAGLIIIKPKTDIKQVDYMPNIQPVQENTSKPEDTLKKEAVTNSASSVESPLGAEQPQEKIIETQPVQEQGAQDKVVVEGVDPVLEEIMAAKRQAEEKQKLINAGVAAEELKSEESEIEEEQQKENPDQDGQTGQQPGESNQTENLQAVKARVQASSLNVRAKESLEGPVIGTLNSGDIVEIIGQSETSEWLNIKFDSGQTGWVMKKYLLPLQ